MADIVRIYAAEHDSTISDISHVTSAPPDIIVEVEAALAEWHDAARFRVSGFLRDYETGAVDTLGPEDGSLTETAPWDDDHRNARFVFEWPGVNITPKVNGVIEMVATVRVGAAKVGADADIETGMFTFVAEE